MDYALMWLVLGVCMLMAIVGVLAAITYWSLRQHWLHGWSVLRQADQQADVCTDAARELHEMIEYSEYPVLSLDTPFGAPAPLSVELRLLQMTQDQPYCPVCVITRCTLLCIPVDRILPLLHGPHQYCERHTRILMAINGEWTYGTEER